MKLNPIVVAYNGLRPIVCDAVGMVNELLRSEMFYENISNVTEFEMADTTPTCVAEIMQSAGLKLQVDLYYAMNPFKNIDGFDNVSRPDLMYLNIWKLERPVASICNTLLHGCVHAANALHPRYSFGHGDHKLQGKEHTAPYQIGRIGERMLSNTKTPYMMLEHDDPAHLGTAIKDHLASYC